LCGKPWPWPRHAPWRPATQCPNCHLYLERREHDSFLGSYTINLMATLLFTVALAVANAALPRVPAWLRDGVMFAGIVLFAVAFHPISKLLWLAVDMNFRPPLERDFDEEGG
jgi:hypothetical protein